MSRYYNDLSFSHSAKGSEWEDHEYVKKINGVYYYPESYMNGKYALPKGKKWSSGSDKEYDEKKKNEQPAASTQWIEGWNDFVKEALQRNPNYQLPYGDKNEFKVELMEAGIIGGNEKPEVIDAMYKKFMEGKQLQDLMKANPNLTVDMIKKGETPENFKVPDSVLAAQGGSSSKKSSKKKSNNLKDKGYEDSTKSGSEGEKPVSTKKTTKKTTAKKKTKKRLPKTSDEIKKAISRGSLRHEDTSNQEKFEDFLMHYGVLGMHWGIRRYQPYSVRGRKSGKNGKEIGDAKKEGNNSVKDQNSYFRKQKGKKVVYKSAKSLTDEELKRAIDRLDLEKRYSDASKTSSRTKRLFNEAVNKIGGEAGKIALGAASSAASYALVKKLSNENMNTQEYARDWLKPKLQPKRK